LSIREVSLTVNVCPTRSLWAMHRFYIFSVGDLSVALAFDGGHCEARVNSSGWFYSPYIRSR